MTPEKNGPRDAEYTTLTADSRSELDELVSAFRREHGLLEWGARPSSDRHGKSWTCRVRKVP